MPAKAGNALTGCNLADRGAAARAGLAALSMDAQMVSPLRVVQRVGHFVRNDRVRPVEDGARRPVQARLLLVADRRALAIRMDARFPEDLVRVGVADTGDELVVDQDALDLPVVAPQTFL